MIGESPALQLARADIDCAARCDAKVLITGETGVGKEVAARMIHQRSERAAKEFVAISCAGVPDSLLESELFGHERGSFTGAYRDKPGLLEAAPNGTVFLDEVGEMSARMQATLLRFLETGEIQRIGSLRPHTRVNVRLITATNRDLQHQIKCGAFREDLYFRLNVIQLTISPLRERIDDIPLLLDHFFQSYGRKHRLQPPTVSSSALDAFIAYRWPGNIRELKNVVERLILKKAGAVITALDLPADMSGPSVAADSPGGGIDTLNTSVDALFSQLIDQRQSFWEVVYPLFMSRDMTRNDLRRLIQKGLARSNGSYRSLVMLFNMSRHDYNRFLAFLRQHNCHVPFQHFRSIARVALPTSSAPTSRRVRP
jgi:transcriptional regulator with PAS, ATPase and Fis domain